MHSANVMQRYTYLGANLKESWLSPYLQPYAHWGANIVADVDLTSFAYGLNLSAKTLDRPYQEYCSVDWQYV